MAAPIKLPRQEGFMVDRDKDAGVDDARLSALRETVPRDRMSTTNEDIAEETRVAHKYSKVRALDPLFSAFLAAVMKCAFLPPLLFWPLSFNVS